MWETYRSDGESHSKHKLAMRFAFVEADCSYSARREWVKVDVLVDGRPAASCKTEVEPGGYVDLDSDRNDIEFAMRGRWRDDSGYGEICLAWDEKVEDYWGDPYMHFVRIRGDFDVQRVHGTHWAAAWTLFDTLGDGVWDVGDETWSDATREGLQYLDSLESVWESSESARIAMEQ
jgi:hypothetical protein